MKKKEIPGFTLVEITVVMTIIAILAVLIAGVVQMARSNSIENVDRSNARTIQSSLETNYAKFREYCGNKTGELRCVTYSSGSYLSVAEAATLFPVAVAIAGGYPTTPGSGSKCYINAGAGTYSGAAGGASIVDLEAQGYVIAIVNSQCTGWTSFSDLLTNGTVTITPPFTADNMPTF